MIAQAILAISWLAFGFWGFTILSRAQGAIHEVYGAVTLLTSTVCFVGVAILGSLDQVRHKMTATRD